VTSAAAIMAVTMCHGEGCPRADLCRRYMDAVPESPYFLMAPVQFNGACTEFVWNGWARRNPDLCAGAHPPPRCTWQCCIEEDA
jgi:hypothetical protein